MRQWSPFLYYGLDRACACHAPQLSSSCALCSAIDFSWPPLWLAHGRRSYHVITVCGATAREGWNGAPPGDRHGRGQVRGHGYIRNRSGRRAGRWEVGSSRRRCNRSSGRHSLRSVHRMLRHGCACTCRASAWPRAAASEATLT